MTNLPSLNSLESRVHSHSSNQALAKLFNNISILVADFLSATETKTNITTPEYGWWDKFDNSDCIDQFPNRKVLEFNNRIFIYVQPKVGNKEEYQDAWFNSVALIIGRVQYFRNLIRKYCLLRKLTRKIYSKLMKVKLKKMPKSIALQPCPQATPLLKELRVKLERVTSLDLQAQRKQKAIEDKKFDNESALKRQLSFDSAKLLPAKKIKYADYVKEYHLRECSVVLSPIDFGHQSSSSTYCSKPENFGLFPINEKHKQSEKLLGLPQGEHFVGLNNNSVFKTENPDVVLMDKNVSHVSGTLSIKHNKRGIVPGNLTTDLLKYEIEATSSTNVSFTKNTLEASKPKKTSINKNDTTKPVAKKASGSGALSSEASKSISMSISKQPVLKSKELSKSVLPLDNKASGSSTSPSEGLKTKILATSTTKPVVKKASGSGALSSQASKSISMSISTHAVPISKELSKSVLPLDNKASGSSTSPTEGLKTKILATIVDKVKKPLKTSKPIENSKVTDKLAVPSSKNADGSGTSPSEGSSPKRVATSVQTDALVKKPLESFKPSEAKPVVPLVKKTSGCVGTPSEASKSVTTSTKTVPLAKKESSKPSEKPKTKFQTTIKSAESLPKITSGGCTEAEAPTTKNSGSTKKTSETRSTPSETSQSNSEVTINSTQPQVKKTLVKSCQIVKSTSDSALRSGALTAKETPKSRVETANPPKIPIFKKTGGMNSNDRIQLKATDLNNGTKTPLGALEAAKSDFLKNFTIPKIRSSKEMQNKCAIPKQSTPVDCDKKTTNSSDVKVVKLESGEEEKDSSAFVSPDRSVKVMPQPETQGNDKKKSPENQNTGRLVSSVGPLLEDSGTLLIVEVKNDVKSMQLSPPANLMPTCPDSVPSDKLDFQKSVSRFDPQLGENTCTSVALSTYSKSSVSEVRNGLNGQGLKNLLCTEKHPSFSKDTRVVSSAESTLSDSGALLVVEVKNDLNTQKVEQVPLTVQLAPKTDRTVLSDASKTENALFVVQVKNDLATTQSETPVQTQDLQPPKSFSIGDNNNTSVPAKTSNQPQKCTITNGNESKWGAPNGGYEFISQDPLENADNFDAGWNAMRDVQNVAERYRLIRERWRNLAIPDPNRNLTFRQLRRDRPPPLLQRDFRRNCYQEDRRGRQRSLSCSSIYEFMILKAKGEAQMALVNLELEQRNDRLNLFDCYRDQFFSYEVLNQQTLDLNNLNQRHEEMRWRIQQQLEKEVRDYEMYINEIRSFHIFYQGLDESDTSDKMQLLPEQVDLIEDIAKHYELYAQIYNQ